MKYRDTNGRLFLPGVQSEVLTGRVLWVDGVHGNDDLAVPERLTIPFKTLTAAKDAANPPSGEYQTIVVLPGTYDEKNLLKNRVNWHFFNGAKVKYTGSGNGALFDTSATNGTNSAIDCGISGFGIFENVGTGTSNYVLYSSTNGSHLVLQGRSLSGYDGCVFMADSTGSLHVEVVKGVHSENGSAVTVTSGYACAIRAHEVVSEGDYALAFSAGSVEIYAHRIICYANSAIDISGGSGSDRIVIHAYEILSNAASPTIKYSAPYSPILAIYNARIQNDLDHETSGRAINIASGGSNKIRLSNCTLITKSSADAAINAASSTKIHWLGISVSNNTNANVVDVGPAMVGGLSDIS